MHRRRRMCSLCFPPKILMNCPIWAFQQGLWSLRICRRFNWILELASTRTQCNVSWVMTNMHLTKNIYVAFVQHAPTVQQQWTLESEVAMFNTGSPGLQDQWGARVHRRSLSLQLKRFRHVCRVCHVLAEISFTLHWPWVECSQIPQATALGVNRRAPRFKRLYSCVFGDVQSQIFQ